MADRRLDFCEADRIRLFAEHEGHGATWHFPSYADFDPAPMVAAGIRHALVDLDGNLTPAYKHDEMTPEVLAAIILMRQAFETMSLATNNELDLSALGEEHGFDHVFQPYQPGTELPYKPDPLYFEHMLATLAVPPEMVVMIGDDPEHDIGGASAHGIQTALVDRLDPYGFFGPAPLPG